MGHRHRHRHSRHAEDRREDGKISDEPDKISKGKRKKHHIHKAERKAKQQHSDSLLSKRHRDRRSVKDTRKRSKIVKKKPPKEPHRNKRRRSSDSEYFSRSKSETSERSSQYSSSDDSLGRSRKRSRQMMELVIRDNNKDSYKGGCTSTLEDCKKIDKCNTKGGSTHGAYSHLKSENSKGQRDDCNAEELEVELRHKALANLLRHRDSSCKSDEQRNSSSLAMEGTSSRQDGKSSDSDADDHRWAFGSDAVLADTKEQLKNNVEDNELATRAKESSAEEGEIRLSDATQDPKTGDSTEAMSNLSLDIVSGVKMDSKNLLVKSESLGMAAIVGSSRQQNQGKANKLGHLQAQPARSHEIKEDLLKRVRASNITQSQQRQLHINPGKEANLLHREAIEKDSVEPKMDRAGPVMSIQGSGIHQTKEEDKMPLFQEKTMSVVRGGEVVQVNYKVYIPKRATELAKRRLRR